jgi:nucleoside-diphosphate-sugar epimerase
MKISNILVTGGAGYIGSVLIPSLIEENYNVKCLDRFFFGKEFLSSKKFEENLELIQDDIRWFDPKILKDIDLVLDLAALSNDPVGELKPELTFEINHSGRVRWLKKMYYH